MNDDFQRRLAKAVEPYCDLLAPFLRGDLDAEVFEREFLTRYLKDETAVDEDVFDVLEGFFGTVEEFVADPKLRNPARGHTDENDLRRATTDLLTRSGML
jgi:hypothetical protein